MTSRDFCFWLQGYLEIDKEAGGPLKPIDPKQRACIERHLALVFKHEIDPSFPKEQQNELNKTHSGRPDPGTVLRC